MNETVAASGVHLNQLRVRYTSKPKEDGRTTTAVYPIVGLELSEPNASGPYQGIRRLLAKLLRADGETFIINAHSRDASFWRRTGPTDIDWQLGRFNKHGQWADIVEMLPKK